MTTCEAYTEPETRCRNPVQEEVTVYGPGASGPVATLEVCTECAEEIVEGARDASPRIDRRSIGHVRLTCGQCGRTTPPTLATEKNGTWKCAESERCPACGESPHGSEHANYAALVAAVDKAIGE